MLWRVAPPIVISPAADTRMLDSSAIRVKLTSAVGHLPTPRGTPSDDRLCAATTITE